MIVRQIFVSVMMVLMLAASSKASIHQMVCLHSGNSEYSFSTIDCCSKDNNTETINRTCCEFFTIQFDTDEVTTTKKGESAKKIAVSPSPLKAGVVEVYNNNYLSLEHYLPPPQLTKLHVLFSRFLC